MTYFVYLKSWSLFLRFLFSSKNPFNFMGGGGAGDGEGGDLYIRHSEGMRNKFYKESESGDGKPFPQI